MRLDELMSKLCMWVCFGLCFFLLDLLVLLLVMKFRREVDIWVLIFIFKGLVCKYFFYFIKFYNMGNFIKFEM